MELRELFNEQRIESGGSAVLLALYSPIGLILLILRIFIGIHVLVVSSLLPKFSLLRRVILRVLQGILGFIVTSEGSKNHDEDVTMVVANHISVFDHVALNLILPCTVPNVWNFPKFLCWSMGFQDMGANQGRQSLVNNVKQYCAEEKHPVLAFPEGSVTSGRAGLLKYSVWPFSVGQSVQPVCISAYRPIAASLSHISSSLWLDIMWFLFVPFTLYHVKISPVMKKRESQTVEDFAREVQVAMATELKIEATKFTSQDKAEYIKRRTVDSSTTAESAAVTKLPPPPLPSDPAPIKTPPTPPPSPTQKEPPKFNFRQSWSEKEMSGELEIMVRQVKEVLCDTDETVIRKDLVKTNSVDATITNIVEGHISPEPSPAPTIEETGNTESEDNVTTSPGAQKFYDTSFAKTSKERQQSLLERKQALMAMARKHYQSKDGDK